jgi:hypothetical protein
VVERGLGSSLSSTKLVRQDSMLFMEIKCLFSIAPEARKGGKSLECLSLKNSNQTLD